MSTVTRSRVVPIALTLITELERAITIASKLEEIAYEEAEFGFFFAAQKIEEDLREHKSVLERLVCQKVGRTLA